MYFVTLCVQNKEPALGDIIDDEMCLSRTGEIACDNWQAIPEHTQGNVALDTFVIMPNHLHGIIAIENNGCRDVALSTDVAMRRDVAMQRLYKPHKNETMSAISPKAGELGAIIRSYKSSIMRWCNENKIPFAWQSRFYDHIIRNEKELERIRLYIEGNPSRWNEDKNHPINTWM